MTAGFFDRFTAKKPWIVESVPPPATGHGAGMSVPEYKSKPYFIVASVEMGNTTTKCILTGTDLEDGRSYVINKTVSMSRDVRPPKPGEEVFGTTLDGTEGDGAGAGYLNQMSSRCRSEHQKRSGFCCQKYWCRCCNGFSGSGRGFHCCPCKRLP